MDKKRNYTEYLKTNKLWVKEKETVMSRNSTFFRFPRIVNKRGFCYGLLCNECLYTRPYLSYLNRILILITMKANNS